MCYTVFRFRGTGAYLCVSQQLCCLFSWSLGLPQDTLLITSRCLLSLPNERVQHNTQKNNQALGKKCFKEVPITILKNLNFL